MFGREPRLPAHFTELRKEFIGKHEVSWEMACTIVYLRRDIDTASKLGKFIVLMQKYGDTIVEDFDLRWLVSICDTYAAHGTQAEALAGLSISALVNMIKLAETEYYLIPHPEYDHITVEELKKQPVHLFSGIMSYRMKNGDAKANMFKRYEQLMSFYPFQMIMSKVAAEIKDRVNVITRLSVA